ncbi:hypothetical protein COT07_02680 [Candidatus Woesearchaeota archaeon CG07_land_8_20_14_0_80_44_23]|nr:MAG: hypothetical protein COT07_02680 [Candidatus Woesearchaeota archaeon CG07_land_8_20_14_0_80_44_23]
MRFSKTELGILKQVAEGNRRVKEIAKVLNKSKFQIYRSGQKLIEKGFVDLSDGFYEPIKSTPSTLLVQLLGEFPSAIEPLSDSGINILKCLFDAKTIKEIMQESGIKRTQVFKKIKQARGISLVRKIDEHYKLNEKIWSKAIEFLKELKKYEETNDQRVPGNSTIYFKNDDEIVFSNKETINATLTAFSAYKDYGIKLLLLKNYYYLPKKKLSMKEIFMHSLYAAKKEMAFQNLVFVALFYAKYKNELSGIKHVILENIDRSFEGKHIPGYPTLQEIKDRAEVYDIKI